MLLQEIVEKIERLPSGGIITDETRFDRGFVITIINTFRAQLIKDLYLKNKRINPVCYQKHYPKFTSSIQEDDCFVKFLCPEVITLDNKSDGFRYIGSIDGSQGFRRIANRSMLSTLNQHAFMAPSNSRFTSVLYDGSDQALEVYGNILLEEVLVEAVFVNPLLIPTYNPVKDTYPLAESEIPLLEEYIFRAQTSVIASVVPDKISNSSDITQAVQSRKR